MLRRSSKRSTSSIGTDGSVVDLGKRNVLGVMVSAVDYEGASAQIIAAARNGRPLAVSALAVHGVMTGVTDDVHRYRLNQLDLVTPDGQPVRWALNLLHRTALNDRVSGPALTLKVCEQAAKQNLPVFFYGSRQEVLDLLGRNLKQQFPGLEIAGMEPSKFRCTTAEEQQHIAERIRRSGAKLVFVGLGCPRQEVFAYEYRALLGMPVIAVGAAFDYHAGLLDEPPMWMQRSGLQWFYRLLQEPRRLWRRYLVLNPYFLALLTLQAFKLWQPNSGDAKKPDQELRYG